MCRKREEAMQEEIKRAIDIAYMAKGFDEKLHERGFIRRGTYERQFLGREDREVANADFFVL